MSIDSIAKLRYSPEKEAAYRLWLQEREEYRNESSLYQRTRRMIPKSQADCSYEQLLVLAAATERYKQACRKYYSAQCTWNAINSPVAVMLSTESKDSAMAKIMEALSSLRSEDEQAEKLRFGAIATSPELSAIAAAASSRNSEAAVPELELEDKIEDFSSDN